MLSPAAKTHVLALAGQLNENKTLSPASQKRLDSLVELIDSKGYINYAEAYRVLFPKSETNAKEKEKADKAFSKFRKTLRNLSQEQHLPLVLKVDDHKNSANQDRQLWFECENYSQQGLEQYNDSYIQNLPETLEEQTVMIKDGRFRYLLRYAEEDKGMAHQLHRQLQTQLNIHEINWTMLDYYGIPIGEDTQQIRQNYYREAHFILLLLSPELIAELKEDSLFKQDQSIHIPLSLKKINQQQLKCIGLEESAIFTDSENKAWHQRGGHKKDEWVETACEAMIHRMQTSKAPCQQNQIVHHLEAAKPNFDLTSKKYYRDQAFKTTRSENTQPAIPYLLDWLNNPNGEVFCGIFGELGMGKTTLCQRLTQTLLEKRKQNPALAFPVYFDLRSVNNLSWDWQNAVPPLDKMIDHALTSTYNVAVDNAKITTDEIKQLAQQQGGLIIFDGLDEVMNRLTPDQSNAFIQQLWNILPPIVYKTDKQTAHSKTHGRIIMSCRSHYFQTLKDQLNSLTGQQREAVEAKDYNWVTLLPLNDKQVEGYFRQVFADNPDQAARIIAMLDQVHNLRELSNRPYNMRLIQEQVDTLEALQRQDKKVSVADLYEGMVGQWLQRDKPKHRLKLEHKLILMESLALLLWTGQQQQLNYADLEDWLIDLLLENKRWQLF